MSTNATPKTKTTRGASSSKERKDAAQVVTELLVAKLEEGTVPWRKPWACLGRPPQNLKSKRPYRGVNALILALMPYSQPYWLSYKQATELGGQVRQGEKSTPVIFWKTFTKALKDKEPGAFWNDEKKQWEKKIWMSKYYRVFNVEQCDGLDDRIPPAPALEPPTPDEAAKAVVDVLAAYYEREGIVRKDGGDRAFYSPARDMVSLPTLAQFDSHAAYALTDAHEGVHSTGAEKRLARPEITNLSGSTFGSEPYSKEELTAEVGSAMLAASLGLAVDIDSSAAYIASWLKTLKDDRQMVVSAAQRAQKAVDLILGDQGPEATADTGAEQAPAVDAERELAIA